MSDANEIALTKPEALSGFFAAATARASKAIFAWTSSQLSISLDEVRETAIEEVSSAVELGDEPMTMVIVGIDGFVDSKFILAFDNASGQRLAACLLGREPLDSPELSELELSALMETANILVSAYLNELSDLSNRELLPSPPEAIHDYGPSVLEQAIMEQAMTCESILLCRTQFEFNSDKLDWSVFLMPGEELAEMLKHSIDTSC